MDPRSEKLAALGYPLERVPAPAALYQPVVVHGGLAFVSGALPFDGPGNLTAVGKVGQDVDLETARRAARLAAANVLRALAAELGGLGSVERVLRVGGYVNATETFTEQHLVVNGASELLLEVLGEAGRHSRAAIGTSQLPLGACVEIDAVFALAGSPR
jgi:enamine deaminase RidA (YjgF/YER057c/UK114 family)